MNKLTIIGNLTRDPETRTVQSGANVCSFTVAVNDPFKKDSVQYFRVSAWRTLADNCQKYLAKGRKVAVVGAVSLNTYSKQDGTSASNMEVNADTVEFLSAAGDNTPAKTETKPATKPAPKPAVGYEEVVDEELPF